MKDTPRPSRKPKEHHGIEMDHNSSVHAASAVPGGQTEEVDRNASGSKYPDGIHGTEVAAADDGVLRFGVFELVPATGELRKAGVLIRIRNQPFRVLHLLASRPGQLVSRDEIQRLLWSPDELVDAEQGLNYCIKEIRAALGDHAESPRFVQTLPRRGYRFLAEVHVTKSERAGEQDAKRPSVFAEAPAAAARLRTPAWLAVAAALAMGLGLAVLTRGARGPSPASDGRARLLVLPFEDLSPAPGDPLFMEGLTEEVIAHLGRVNPERLVVLARTTTREAHLSGRDLGALAKDFRVDYFVEASARRTGATLRVTTALVRANGMERVWSETVDHEVATLSRFQADLAAKVARGVDITLVRNAAPRTTAPPSTAAYSEYLRARALWNRRDRDSLLSALAGFERVVSLLPDYALGWIGVADTYFVLTDHGYLGADEGWLKARAAADRAVSLDGGLAEAWTAVAMYRALYEWNWAGAEQAFQRSIALNPSIAHTHHWRGLALSARGQRAAAVEALKHAAELDPLSPTIRGALGQALALDGNAEAGLKEIRAVTLLRPDWGMGHVWTGKVLASLGRFDDALKEFEAAAKLQATPATLAHLTRGYVLAGRTADAKSTFTRLRASADAARQPYYLALAAWSIGDRETALARLADTFAQRSPHLRLLPHGEEWASLASDERFARLVSVLNAGPRVTPTELKPAGLEGRLREASLQTARRD